jgi:hypothetical protein
MAELLRKIHEIVVGEIEAVQVAAPIWRVQIKQRRFSVEALEDFGIRQALDLNALKSLMCIFKELGNTSGIEARWSNDAVAVFSVADQASERVLLEIKKPGGALDIGQRIGVFGLEEGEPLPADQDELEVPDELLMVVLADPEEAHHIGIQIVQNFDSGRLLAEENLRASGEGLNIRRVLRENLDDLRGDTIFSSYVS